MLKYSVGCREAAFAFMSVLMFNGIDFTLDNATDMWNFEIKHNDADFIESLIMETVSLFT